MESLLTTHVNSYGKAVPSIHVDLLGMDDFEARVIMVELETIFVVCCYAPATGDEIR